jgi:hypothetical protein
MVVIAEEEAFFQADKVGLHVQAEDGEEEEGAAASLSFSSSS